MNPVRKLTAKRISQADGTHAPTTFGWGYYFDSGPWVSDCPLCGLIGYKKTRKQAKDVYYNHIMSHNKERANIQKIGPE